MDAAGREALIREMCGAVIGAADELTRLDQAIGDGDHGVNMRRGAEAVLAQLPDLAARPWADLLKAVGMALVMKVGGASGPLYGTLFMELGKGLPEAPARADWVAAFGRAIAAVMARGKGTPGAKTMLDVLVPVHRSLEEGLAADRLAAEALAAAEATGPLQASRGRASFLGERSVGHVDPGARSSALLLAALARKLEG